MFSKIAVIGDKDSMLAFKAAGADVFDAVTTQQAQSLVKQLSKENYAIVLIADKLAWGLADVLKKAKTKPFPIFVPIPTEYGAESFGIQSLRADVEKAIGTDIIFNEKKQ